jgi:hypothetical protein
LRSFSPPARLRFEGGAIPSLRTILINGRELPIHHSSRASALVVDASEWSAAGAPLAIQTS